MSLEELAERGDARSLGELAERIGDLPRAVGMYQKAAHENPGRKSFLRLARVLFKLGEWRACLNAYEKAAAIMDSPNDGGHERIEEATICAVIALYELGYLEEARANCPTLRQLQPGNSQVESLCKIIEAPWKSPSDPLGCGRVCFSASWRAPWEEHSVPSPRTHCTRKEADRLTSDLYRATQVKTSYRPRGPHPVVVMTSSRPTPSLPATLASLRKGGSHRWPWPTLLVSDGPVCPGAPDELLSRWLVRQTTSKTGSAMTFVRALEEALGVQPDLEYLTFLEDDVEVCHNFLDYARIVEIPPELSLVTWFTYEFPGEKTRHEEAQKSGWSHPRTYKVPVLAQRSVQNFILAQCMTLSRDAVDRILRCPRIRDWPQENGHDEMPAWALGDSPYAAHFPILVQHTGGLNSAVAANRTTTPTGRDPQAGERTSPDYVGHSFNALSLAARTRHE